ncbi:predicted protein [Uncinocarpus reesii 1704]|uniref:F-box domain-containing protein n=1 Tax=Uncinocarpus reesii (strain UAMH 1704) TaxID=336963 RepID=C4JFH6_UNCRE|nr:uncharacterized protein UREG_00990 [Uncinocarpus reesii 1704]EEP76141.1 predicted protein [Uncinocarpus reesii 1704]
MWRPTRAIADTITKLNGSSSLCLKMSLAALPTELLELILDDFIPPDWNLYATDDDLRWFKLRLVCSRFDAILSRQAFRKLHSFSLCYTARHITPAAKNWLLNQKLLLLERKLGCYHEVGSPNGGSRPGASDDHATSTSLLTNVHGVELGICYQIAYASDLALYQRYFKERLSLAAYRGDIAAVASLIAQGTDVKCQKHVVRPSNYTAAACFHGFPSVVCALLEHKATDPILECAEESPLCIAAGQGNEDVVRMLLERPNVTIGHEGTISCPLWYAAYFGHAGVLRLLLDKFPVCPDKYGLAPRTLLWFAACQGHTSVVQMLLERDDVNPNCHDSEGNTALLIATRNGHHEIVQLLLQRDDLNPNIKSSMNYTPLFEAAFKGHEAIVRSLLQCPAVDPNLGGCFDQSPISVAAEYGLTKIVGIFVERKDINVNSQNRHRRTPLSFACEKGNDEMVRLLLTREDIVLDIPDAWGYVPLMWAFREAYTDIILMLLERQLAAPVSVIPKKVDSKWKRLLTQTLFRRPETKISAQTKPQNESRIATRWKHRVGAEMLQGWLF